LTARYTIGPTWQMRRNGRSFYSGMA